MPRKEIRWYYGYSCKVATEASEWGEWYGLVDVPIYHPVRTKGLDDLIVLKLSRGIWTVFIDDVTTRHEMLDAVQLTAAKLRSMQNEWDQLSPYEREYRIW
jgi:hypothetical protein